VKNVNHICSGIWGIVSGRFIQVINADVVDTILMDRKSYITLAHHNSLKANTKPTPEPEEVSEE
jgi:hypothetical protein